MMAEAMLIEANFLLLDSHGQESWRYLGVIPRETIETELKAVLP